MSKRWLLLLLTLYSLTVSAMEETRISMPSTPASAPSSLRASRRDIPRVTRSLTESEEWSKKAVDLYFRGNAKSLHDTILPYIKFKIEEANNSPKPDPVIWELKDLSIYGAANVSLGNHIHKLVTESLEEALKEKELALRSLEERERNRERQRNAAIGAAVVSTLGAATAALTHISNS